MSTMRRVSSRCPPTWPPSCSDDSAAKAAWDKLSYSHQRAHAESITGAKAEATRAKRVAKVLDALRSV